MRISLTLHAKAALVKRRIPVEWVESVVQNPQWTEDDPTDPTLKRYFAEVSDFDSRVLKVVLDPSVDPARIVTVHFDRRKRRLS